MPTSYNPNPLGVQQIRDSHDRNTYDQIAQQSRRMQDEDIVNQQRSKSYKQYKDEEEQKYLESGILGRIAHPFTKPSYNEWLNNGRDIFDEDAGVWGGVKEGAKAVGAGAAWTGGKIADAAKWAGSKVADAATDLRPINNTKEDKPEPINVDWKGRKDYSEKPESEFEKRYNAPDQPDPRQENIFEGVNRKGPDSGDIFNSTGAKYDDFKESENYSQLRNMIMDNARKEELQAYNINPDSTKQMISLLSKEDQQEWLNLSPEEQEEKFLQKKRNLKRRGLI